MKLIHYSKHPNLTHIDPEYFGTGAPSSETKGGIPKVKRSYFYTAGSEPESLVTSASQHKYDIELPDTHKIYDIYEDPENHVSNSVKEIGNLDSDHFLNKIKESGYHGYMSSHPNAMNNVVALFHTTPTGIVKSEILQKNDVKLPPHFIFTTENPLHKISTSPKSIHDMHQELLNNGEDAHVMNGHYGSPEKSIIVFNPKNVNKLHNLALAHGQDSAIQSDGTNHSMFYYHGPHAGYKIQGTGTQVFESQPKDFYSTLHTPTGPLHFSHNFEFNKYIKDSNIPQLQESNHEDPFDNAKEARGGEREFANIMANHIANNNLKKNIDENGFLAPFNDKANKTVASLQGDYIGDHRNLFDAPVRDIDTGYHDLVRDFEGNPEAFDSLYKKVDPTLLYSAYKNSPHNPLSVALKYAVHRIENADKYLQSGKHERDLMDEQFLNQHKEHHKASKNLTIHDLREFMNKNQHLPNELLSEQHQLHQFLLKHSKHKIHNVDGKPSVPLTRGYSIPNPGPDLALASYADVKDPGFGSYNQHRLVPLHNLWFGYDTGLKHASNTNYGPENEYIVSPHTVVNTDKSNVGKLAMNSTGEYTVRPEHFLKHKLVTNDPTLDPAYLQDIIQKGPSSYKNNTPYSILDIRHAFNHANMTEDIIDQGLTSNNDALKEHILSDANLTDRQQANLISQRMPPDHVAQFVTNPSLNSNTLHQLSKHPNPNTRKDVALHNNTSIETLRILQKDPYDSVRVMAERALSKKWKPDKLAASESSVSDLNKALTNRTFGKFDASFGGYHSARNKDTSPYDDQKHIKRFQNPKHQDYIKNTLHSPDQVHELQSPGGIFSKAIHRHSDGNTYMVKPYYDHDINYDGDNSPLSLGWNGLTAQDIYKSAGLGHLISPSSAVQYKHPDGSDLPVVVHKFEDPNKFHTLAHAQNIKQDININPLEFMKANTINYLINHSDTHAGNLLVGKEQAKTGYNPIKYIDHDLAFHYSHCIRLSSALFPHGSDDSHDDELYRHVTEPIGKDHLSSTIDWWNKHKDSIKKTFNENLKSVKGRKLKKNLKDNFEVRHNHIDKMFNKTPEALINRTDKAPKSWRYEE